MHTLGSLAVAAMVFWQASNMQAQLRRLAVNPHATGHIEKTWIRYGKWSGRFADLTFTGSDADGALACRARGVRIGPPSLNAAPGESIDIVPRPGECASPDIPTDAAPALVVWLFFGGSFLIGTIALMKLTSTPMIGARIRI